MIFPSETIQLNAEWFYDEHSGETNFNKVELNCPSCNKRKFPFRARLESYRPIYLDGGWRWVGTEYKEPYFQYSLLCKCGAHFKFVLYYPQ